MISLPDWMLRCASAAWLVGWALVPGALRGDAPNIVVIIADDLGYGEIGITSGMSIPTPAIDALAASGVTCRSGYVTSSYCSPSRAGILTGRYQSRFGYDINPTGPRNLHPKAGVPVSEVMFVQRLADAGYATGLFGKWHLGTADVFHPIRRGFDSFYGFLHEGHYYVPGPPYANVLTMVRDRSLPEGQRRRAGNLIRGNYAPINEPAYDDDNPLLQSRGGELFQVQESRYLTDAITDEAVAFLSVPREKPVCVVVAYNAVHSPMQAKLDRVSEYSSIKDPQRRIFAGMLASLDRGVGRLCAAIDAMKSTEPTLVVFLSDNGGPTRELTSSNLPLRGEKGSLYEGGVRIPMIWSMPGRLPEGFVDDRVTLSLDIAATALDLAGVAPPSDADGKSVMGWMPDPDAASPHSTVYWRMPGGKAALRQGDWKLVRPRNRQSFELYHLVKDIGETNDLASEMVIRRDDMIERYQQLDAAMSRPIQLD